MGIITTDITDSGSDPYHMDQLFHSDDINKSSHDTTIVKLGDLAGITLSITAPDIVNAVYGAQVGTAQAYADVYAGMVDSGQALKPLAGIGRHNPGTEAIVLTYQMPLADLFGRR